MMTFAHGKAEHLRIEYPGDSDVYVVLTVKAIGKGLSYTFAFVVTSPRTDRIDMAPTFHVSRISDNKKNLHITY